MLLNARLATPRLVLEPLTAAHAALLFQPLQAEALYIWISSTPPESVEALAERYALRETRISPQADEAWLNWAVRLVDGGTHVGKVDAAVDGAGVVINLGYLFFPAFWGQGYATEAVQAAVGHFERHRITELRATVSVGNDASGRVLEKAGFVRTRILPDNDTIRGVSCDDIEYVRSLGASDD